MNVKRSYSPGRNENSPGFNFICRFFNKIAKARCNILNSKEGKEMDALTNWRPIILLKSDYKIATNSIANRI